MGGDCTGTGGGGELFARARDGAQVRFLKQRTTERRWRARISLTKHACAIRGERGLKKPLMKKICGQDVALCGVKLATESCR